MSDSTPLLWSGADYGVEMATLIGALLGAALGSGMVAVFMGWLGVPLRLGRDVSTKPRRSHEPVASHVIRVAMAVAGIATSILLTGWLIPSLIVGIIGFGTPSLWRAKSVREREIERMAALATWVEMLRDTIGAASGLVETLKATAVAAPSPIRAPVRQLAARAEREPLPDALAKFAADVNHGVADTVAVTLGLAATNQVGSLQESLTEIAENTRQEVSMRLRTEASRARQFTSARFIAAVVAVFSVGLMAFSRSYLAPFDTLSGQVALTVIGGLFVGSGFALLKMSRFKSPPRILDVYRIPATADSESGLRQ